MHTLYYGGCRFLTKANAQLPDYTVPHSRWHLIDTIIVIRKKKQDSQNFWLYSFALKLCHHQEIHNSTVCVFYNFEVRHPRCVEPKLLNGKSTVKTPEALVLKENTIQKLLVFERKILRRIFGPTKENQIWKIKIKTNEELDKLIKHKNIVNHIKAQRLSWFDHMQRMLYLNS